MSKLKKKREEPFLVFFCFLTDSYQSFTLVDQLISLNIWSLAKRQKAAMRMFVLWSTKGLGWDFFKKKKKKSQLASMLSPVVA